MQQDGHISAPVVVVREVLLGAALAQHHGVDGLQVAGVGHQGQVNLQRGGAREELGSQAGAAHMAWHAFSQAAASLLSCRCTRALERCQCLLAPGQTSRYQSFVTDRQQCDSAFLPFCYSAEHWSSTCAQGHARHACRLPHLLAADGRPVVAGAQVVLDVTAASVLAGVAGGGALACRVTGQQQRASAGLNTQHTSRRSSASGKSRVKGLLAQLSCRWQQ